jgi:nucleotide-binding universal stress UspA family protein
MYANILVPVAYEEGYDASRAVQAAVSLAEPEALVTLLHVMEPLPPYALSFMTDEYREGLKQAIHDDLARLAGTLPNLKVAVIEGHPARSILSWAREHGSDLIILASHRPGMAQVLLGSTATQVVGRAHCAVHILRDG